MKILFLSHRLPYPPNKGDKIRSHALFTHLAAKHQVYLGCFIDDPADFRYAEMVREMAGGDCKIIPLTRSRKLLSAAQAMASGASITAEAYRSSDMQHWVDSVVQTEAIDCAVVFSSSMAPYLLSGKYLPPQRVLFDMVDLDSDKWLQYSGLAGLASAWIYRREARKLLELERQAAAKFALTYLVSAHEVQSFAQLAPESSARIRAFCNGVNLEYFAPGGLCLALPCGRDSHRDDRPYGLLAQCRRRAVVRPRSPAPGQAANSRCALLCRRGAAGIGAAQFLRPRCRNHRRGCRYPPLCRGGWRSGGAAAHRPGGPEQGAGSAGDGRAHRRHRTSLAGLGGLQRPRHLGRQRCRGRSPMR